MYPLQDHSGVDMYTSELTEKQQGSLSERLKYYGRIYDNYKSSYKLEGDRDCLNRMVRILELMGKLSRAYLCNHSLEPISTKSSDMTCIRCKTYFPNWGAVAKTREVR